MTSRSVARTRLVRAASVAMVILLSISERRPLRGAAGDASAGQTAVAVDTRIDQVFVRWNQSTPGCSVGVAARDGTLTRAYGMADLEHDVRNTEDTIFEAGSVSKQFLRGVGIGGVAQNGDRYALIRIVGDVGAISGGGAAASG